MGGVPPHIKAQQDRGIYANFAVKKLLKNIGRIGGNGFLN
jgi:hypothetical protein